VHELVSRQNDVPGTSLICRLQVIPVGHAPVAPLAVQNCRQIGAVSP
jgi:hypothetical protein